MSALTLRIIASVCMLCDHIGYCLAGRYPFLEPLRWIGRLAFPLYVFLIVNGYRHTSNRVRYALRLLLFAILSQVPFSLMFFRKHGYFYCYNVFVTLLLSLLTVWVTDVLRKHKIGRWFTPLPTILAVAVFYFDLFRADYGAKGILLAMTFYLFDGNLLLTTIGTLASVYYAKLISLGFSALNVLRGKAFALPKMGSWELTQLFSLLALVMIFFYNGQRGKLPEKPAARKAVQLGFYIFYPVHLLLLFYLLRYPGGPRLFR